MKAALFNHEWKFWEVTNSFALNWEAPEDARVLDLPHDAMIEMDQDPDCRSGANTGYRKGGVFSYSRSFFAASPDRTYILKIEGAYMNAFVYVNGQLAAKRPLGYSVFYVPLNPFLQYDRENEIRIQVRSGAEPNSRWYSGTGLYRDVYLLEAGSQYIRPDSVQIRTVQISEGALRKAAAAYTVSAEEKKTQSLKPELILTGSPETQVQEENLSDTGSVKAASVSGSNGFEGDSGIFHLKLSGTPTAAGGKDTAQIRISALLANRGTEKTGTLEICITDPFGQIAATAHVQAGSEPAADHSATSRMLAFAGSEDADHTLCYPSDVTMTIPQPLLWNTDTPYLYTCTLRLRNASGEIIDIHQETFGIRSLSVSAAQGFRVNGQEVKLRGACIHHDSGILGAKTYEDTHIRQIRKLKESGFNAIRSAHNPAAPALLKACDKVGMYVMDEAFDIWTRHKSDYDYGLFFEEWWEADVESMVMNDFNHPCVVMYSIGNEIPEIGTPQGERIARMICEKIHSMDETRFTLASVNGIFSVGDALGQIIHDVASDLQAQGRMEGNVNDFMAFMHTYMDDMTSHSIVDEVISAPFRHTDIAGYNYMGSRYELDGSLHPDRVIVGSETGIINIADNWKMVMKLPYLIGDFCWTGWEYLGESGIGFPNYDGGSNPFGVAAFPLQISGTGCIDITGQRLPMSYYREIIFGLRREPYIAVQDPAHYGEQLIRNPWIMSDAIGSWSFENITGKPVTVEVYSADEEVELFKNGVSLGTKKVGEELPNIAFFDTTYEPGTLTAVSKSSGQETGRWELTGSTGALRLIVEEEPDYLTMDFLPVPDPEQAPEAETAPGIFDSVISGIAAQASMAAKPLSKDISIQNAGSDDRHTGLEAGSQPLRENASAASDSISQKGRLHFLRICLADENGSVPADRDAVLHLQIDGDAQLLGFGSADPKPAYNYLTLETKTWRGTALLVLRTIEGHAPVRITVTADTGETDALKTEKELNA